MSFWRKASFLIPQKFLRRSDEAFVGLSFVLNDVVMGVCTFFPGWTEVFIYELLLWHWLATALYLW